METIEVTINEEQVNALQTISFGINQKQYPADIQKVYQDAINLILNALNDGQVAIDKLTEIENEEYQNETD